MPISRPSSISVCGVSMSSVSGSPWMAAISYQLPASS
jgi:hypothetical protein